MVKSKNPTVDTKVIKFNLNFDIVQKAVQRKMGEEISIFVYKKLKI